MIGVVQFVVEKYKLKDRVINLTITISITNGKFFELMNTLSDMMLELPEEFDIKLEHIYLETDMNLGNG